MTEPLGNPQIPESMRGDDVYLERATKRHATGKPKKGGYLERFLTAEEKMFERLNIDPNFDEFEEKSK